MENCKGNDVCRHSPENMKKKKRSMSVKSVPHDTPNRKTDLGPWQIHFHDHLYNVEYVTMWEFIISLFLWKWRDYSVCWLPIHLRDDHKHYTLANPSKLIKIVIGIAIVLLSSLILTKNNSTICKFYFIKVVVALFLVCHWYSYSCIISSFSLLIFDILLKKCVLVN